MSQFLFTFCDFSIYFWGHSGSHSNLHAPKNWKSISKTEEKRFFFITECGSSQLFLYKRRILKLTTQLLLIEKRAPPNSVYYRSNSSRNRQRYSWELQFSFSLKSAQWSVCVWLLVGYRKKNKMWSILILVCPLIYPIHSANIACQDIRYKYASTGSDVYNVPITPQSGKFQKGRFL